MECKHKNVEKCHYTYITYFKPAQEETCEENFEKSCQITFKQEAVKETIRKCYRPLEKVKNERVLLMLRVVQGFFGMGGLACLTLIQNKG